MTSMNKSDLDPECTTDLRNIADKYKGWLNDLIREDLQKHSFNFAVCFEHWQGDFNMSTGIRNANGLGAKEVYYSGIKRWDRRGAVGTHHYTNVKHLPNAQAVEELKNHYVFVGVDNIPGSVSIDDYDWGGFTRPVLMVFGEEGTGLTPEMQVSCEAIVEIPMVGSVRSLNCGTASGIVMRDYVVKFQSQCKHQFNNNVCSNCFKVIK